MRAIKQILILKIFWTDDVPRICLAHRRHDTTIFTVWRLRLMTRRAIRQMLFVSSARSALRFGQFKISLLESFVIQYWVQYPVCEQSTGMLSRLMQPAPVFKGCWVPSPALSGSHKGFIKCRVGRHEAGGLWKCVLLCVCLCVCTAGLPLCAPIPENGMERRMSLRPSAHACVCTWLHGRACVADVSARMPFFPVLWFWGLCPLEGVPACQLRERKTRSEAGGLVRSGTNTEREKTR